MMPYFSTNNQLHPSKLCCCVVSVHALLLWCRGLYCWCFFFVLFTYFLFLLLLLITDFFLFLIGRKLPYELFCRSVNLSKFPKRAEIFTSNAPIGAFVYHLSFIFNSTPSISLRLEIFIHTLYVDTRYDNLRGLGLAVRGNKLIAIATVLAERY